MLFPPSLMVKIWQKCLESVTYDDKLTIHGYGKLSWEEKVACSKIPIKSHSVANFQKIEESDFPRIHRIMNEIAGELNQPMPTLHMFENRAPLSLASAFIQYYSIGINKVACEELSDEALKGLLAHEFSHFFDKRAEFLLLKSSLKMLDRQDNSPVERVLWNVAYIASELVFLSKLRENERDADGLATYFTMENKGKWQEEAMKLLDREYSKQKQKETSAVEKKAFKNIGITDVPLLRRFSSAHPPHKNRLKDMEKGTYIERSMKRFEEEANDRTK